VHSPRVSLRASIVLGTALAVLGLMSLIPKQRDLAAPSAAR
jgi:hypothetical protein